ncbi:hypothetical protein HWV62_29751 [Athelia sp. TMB]|nr:hypothetical protein HWV62_29751 [Athelia sp. TMB]
MMMLRLASVLAVATAVIALSLPARSLDIQAPSLVYIDTLPPSGGSGSYQYHLTNTKTWNTLPSDVGSFGLANSGDKAGYRLTGDDASAIVYELAGGVGSSLAGVYYNDTDEDISMDFQMYGSIYTTFPGKAAIQRRGNTWGGSYPKSTVPFNSSITVDNIKCDGDLTFTVVVTSSSPTKTFTGVNHVGLPLTTLPANVTITNLEHSGASLTLFYYNTNPLSVTHGKGSNVPSYSADINGQVQFCPD